jgi:large repetitive protein
LLILFRTALGLYQFLITPPSTTWNYLDQFNSNTIANQSNGSSIWNTSWTKIGDVGDFSQNNVTITSANGLKVTSNAGIVSGAYRSANLNNAISASLSIKYTEVGLDLDVNDYVDLQVASSSAPSSWHLLKRYTGADGNQTGTDSFDISAYMSSVTTIRMVSSGSSGMNNADIVYFDNVSILYQIPVATNYLVRLTQPIPTGYSLTTPLPSPTGTRSAAFTGSGSGSCANNFGLAVADLAIVKTVNNTTPYVGDTVTFTITAKNNGPGIATGVEVTDNIPAGYSLISVSLSSGTWIAPTWTIGNMANAQTETMNFVAKVNATGSYVNTAIVAGSQPDPNPDDNDSTAITYPIPVADLSILKTVDIPTPHVGDTITFKLVAKNLGPSPGTGVIVLDSIPSGYTFVTSSTAKGSYVYPNWNIGNLAVGDSATLFLAVKVKAAGIYLNTGKISGNQLDRNLSNNVSSSTPTILRPSLTIDKTQISGQNPITSPGVLNYSIVVANNGNEALSNVTLVDTLSNGASGTLTSFVESVTTNGILEIGETFTYLFNYNVTQTDIDSGKTIINYGVVTTTELPEPEIDSVYTPISQLPSLTIEKSQIGGQTPLISPDQIDYEIVITNTGNQRLTNVVVSDTLPNRGLGVLSAVTESISPSNSILDIGETFMYTISYNVSQAEIDSGTAIINKAVVTTKELPIPKSDTAKTNITQLPSLSITKTQIGGQNPLVTPGQVDYSIVVSNTGNIRLTNITVRDTLPDGSAGILPSPTESVLTNGILDIGETFTYAISYNVLAADMLSGDALINTAYAKTNETPTYMSDTASTEVSTADLSLTKTVSNSTPNVGDVVTFTIQVSNAGPDAATNLEIEDYLPLGYSSINSIAGGGIYLNDTITWSIDTLLAGADSSFTFTAKVNAPTGAANEYKNTTQVTKVDQFDSDSTPDNDDGDQSEDDEASSTINQQVADLSLTKTVSNNTPNVGDVVTFTIQVSNAGPDAATNLEIEDYLPIGYSSINTITGGGIYLNDTITWSIDTLLAGADSSFTFTAKVNAPTGVANDYKNTTQVTKVDQFDSDSTPDNDDGDQSEDDEASSTINKQVADLSLTKTVSNSTPNVGDVVTFTIQVSNAGPDAAMNLEIEDYLPLGYSSINSITGGGIYLNDTITWSIDTLLAGADSSFTFTAKVNAPTGAANEYKNTTQVTKVDQFDGDSTPNNDDGDQSEDDEASATINQQIADLSLTKTVSSNTPNVGDIVTFTITVNNAGPSIATNVKLADYLPIGYSTIGNITGGGVYLNDTIKWNIATLAVGKDSSLTFTAKVNAPTGAANEYKNTTQVTKVDQFDEDSTPNNDDGDQSEDDEASATINQQIADLSLTKTVSNNTPNVGDVVMFTIQVSNAGPDAATNLEIEDYLPIGYSSINAITGGGIYLNDTITWSIDTLLAGADSSFTFTAIVRIPTGAAKEYVNVAEVTASDQHDPDSEPNNGIPTEDDFDTACVSPLLKLCKENTANYILNVPTGYAAYQWKKDGLDIPGAVFSTYNAIEGGVYTVLINGQACLDGNCCPFIIQEDCNCEIVTSNCVPFIIKRTK